MKLLSLLSYNHSLASAQCNSACAEATSYLSQVDKYLNDKHGLYIDEDWTNSVQSECERRIAELKQLSKKTLFSKAKLNKARKKLDGVYWSIDDTVQHHNETAMLEERYANHPLPGRLN